MKIYEIGQWSSLKYVAEEEDRVEQQTKKYGAKEKFWELISGRGWSYLPKEVIASIQNSMANYTRSVKIVSPRHGKVKIVYRRPGEKVFVVDQPRLPLFSLLMHHHGKHRATVDEEFKCVRCGKEVPTAIKALVMAETLGSF